jgi:predicted nucleic acid-binding protein
MPGIDPSTEYSFVDTNVWLYALVQTDDVQKRERAKEVVSRANIMVSVQVINETCVNLLRKASVSEETVRQLVAAFYERCAVLDSDLETLLAASESRERYGLSFWDSMIVASALRAGCKTLYTEDMQDGMNVAGRLDIVNPFKVQTSG